jgi:hypothetical protein
MLLWHHGASLGDCLQLFEKRNKGGGVRAFFPLRAVGLALESGYKLCHKGALGLVAEADLKEVRVTGKLQVLEGSAWNETSAVSLGLRSQDAALALKLLKKQRELLSDLDSNWFLTDTQQGGSKSLDLVGDFSTKRNFGVLGRVWVEVKPFGKQNCKVQADKARATLRTELGSLKRRDQRFGAVLFLTAECETLGAHWGTAKLNAELLRSEEGEWESLTGKRKAARGQAQNKPSFAQLWTGLEKHTTVGREKVRLLKHFLQKLRLPFNDTPRRKNTYDSLLRSAKRPDRLGQEKVLEKSGLEPVVGNKATLRELYKLL